MMMVIGSLVFASALVASIAIIASTVSPQWRRIVRLATGQVEEPFAPLATLAHAERRIAVRRWASAPMPASMRRFREAA